jgi:Condensation domain
MYEAYTEQQPDPLPVPALQYKDYCSWVNRYINSSKGVYSRNYYHQKILTSIENEMRSGAGISKLSSYKKQLYQELTCELKRKDVQDITERMLGYIVNIYPKKGNCFINYFTGTDLTNLKTIAVKNKVTVFTVLVAALAIAFYRVRNEQFLRMYLPCSTRVFEKLDGMAGWFVGEVIVCIDVNETSSLKNLIPIVENEILESANHRLYPHEKLMKEMDITLDILAPVQINYVRQLGVIKDFTPRQSAASCHFGFRCAINDYENGIEFLTEYNLAKYTDKEVENMYAEILNMIDEGG